MHYSKIIDKYSFIFLSLTIFPLSVFSPVLIWIPCFFCGLIMFFFTKNKKSFIDKPSKQEYLCMAFMLFSLITLFWTNNISYAIGKSYEIVLLFIIFRVLFKKSELLEEKIICTKYLTYSFVITCIFLLLDFIFLLGIKSWISLNFDSLLSKNTNGFISYDVFHSEYKNKGYSGSGPYSRGLATLCIFFFLIIFANWKYKIIGISIFFLGAFTIFFGVSLTVKISMVLTSLMCFLIYLNRKFFFKIISIFLAIYFFSAPYTLNIIGKNEWSDHNKRLYIESVEINKELNAHNIKASFNLDNEYLDLRARLFLNNLIGKISHRLVVWSFTSEQIYENFLFGKGIYSSRKIGETNKINLKQFTYDNNRDGIIDENEEGSLISLDYYYSAIPLHPHNTTLQVWLELGLVGVFLYGILFLSLWRRIIYEKNTTRLKVSLLSGTALSIFLINQSSFGLWQTWWLSTIALSIIFLNIIIKKKVNF